jgi:hypothetical protein
LPLQQIKEPTRGIIFQAGGSVIDLASNIKPMYESGNMDFPIFGSCSQRNRQAEKTAYEKTHWSGGKR